MKTWKLAFFKEMTIIPPSPLNAVMKKDLNMHSWFSLTYIIRVFTYCTLVCNHVTEPSRLLSIERSLAPSHVQKENVLAERNHRILLNAVLLWRFSWKVDFAADKWTVQSIYAKQVLNFFYDFFFFQFQQVLLLVACLLTQLTFCVSALYMSSALYYCFGSNFSGRGDFLSESFVWIVSTNKFVYRAGDCVPNSEWTFVFFMGNLKYGPRTHPRGMRTRTKKWKIKN